MPYTTVTTAKSWGAPWLGLLAGLVLTGAIAWLLGAVSLHLSGPYLRWAPSPGAWHILSVTAWKSWALHDGIAGIAPPDPFGRLAWPAAALSII